MDSRHAPRREVAPVELGGLVHGDASPMNSFKKKAVAVGTHGKHVHYALVKLSLTMVAGL